MVQKPVESTSNNAEWLPLRPFFRSTKTTPCSHPQRWRWKKIVGPKTRRTDVKQCRMTPPKAISSIDENYPLKPPSKMEVKKIVGPKTRRTDVKQCIITSTEAKCRWVRCKSAIYTLQRSLVSSVQHTFTSTPTTSSSDASSHSKIACVHFFYL